MCRIFEALIAYGFARILKKKTLFISQYRSCTQRFLSFILHLNRALLLIDTFL